MATMTLAIKALEQERARLRAELDQINRALGALGSTRTRHKLSTAITRIRAAQKVRWGEVAEGKEALVKLVNSSNPV